MDFILNEEQSKALPSVKEWYESKNTNPFVILGSAGTGKSVLVRYILEALKLPYELVKFVTFTGKAASVLIKKGNPATTIHKLIYDPIFDKDDNIIGFNKKESIPETVKLIILDEFYMVSDEILKDLLSFNTKIICLGDNYQLPPPFGKANQLYKNPNVVLTQVMRQTSDSPILYLAELAKQHKAIKPGRYGDTVLVTNKHNMDLSEMRKCDQIIAGKNDTVKQLNRFYRQNFLHIPKEEYLPRPDEKLLCLRNNWNLICNEDNIQTNLVNGLGIINKSVIQPDLLEVARINCKPDFYNETEFKNITLDTLMFKYNYNKVEELFDEKNKIKYEEIIKKRQIIIKDKHINKFTYGYAITCHKSQGSEWRNVFYIFEPFRGRTTDIYWQMLYTGITRASEKLTLVI